LWDVEKGQQLKPFCGHTSRVVSVAFREETPIIASGSEDQTIKLWNSETNKCLNTL
jgi:WD40 repeat protein